MSNYQGPKMRKKNLGIFCLNNAPRGGYLKVEYKYTVDGDTAYFNVSGVYESVRFYVINTPELARNEPYAEEAKQFTQTILENAQEIYLQSDVHNILRDNTESRRILAWVWVDGRLLNYLLVEQGLATIKYVENEKVLYLNILRHAQRKAEQKQLGIHKELKVSA